MKKLTVEIEVSNIEVDEGYFSFDYVATVNGKRKRKQEYSDDYENGDTPKQWKDFLEKGYAHKIALEQLSQTL